MNFIIKLLRLRDPVIEVIYNIIWVVVNYYIKKVYYILFREEYNSEKLY